MRAFRDLVTRARAGQLRSSEFSDPTITVTSLGERGAESTFPIIFPPQVAIVGVKRLLPLPCTNATTPAASTGAASVPGEHVVGGILTSRRTIACSPGSARGV